MENRFSKLDKITKENKVLLLTHTDMDGSGPVILLRSIFDNVDVEHCSNGLMSKVIRNRATDFKTAEEYDTLIACDISCSEYDADIINQYRKIKNLVLLDHHDTAAELNNYKWACVEPKVIKNSYRDDVLFSTDAKSEHSSGTSLMYDYLEYCNLTRYIPNDEFARELVFFITGYDTWDWYTCFHKDMRFNSLNNLFTSYGYEKFEETYIDRIKGKANPVLFNETDELLLQIYESKRRTYLEKTKNFFRTGNIKFNDKYYSFMFCTANEYLSDVVELMKETDDDMDLYIIDYGHGLSFRTTKDTVHVGNLLKPFGGGGHAGAGGIRIPFSIKELMFEKILNTPLYFDD